jgi:hypothetical protein
MYLSSVGAPLGVNRFTLNEEKVFKTVGYPPSNRGGCPAILVAAQDVVAMADHLADPALGSRSVRVHEQGAGRCNRYAHYGSLGSTRSRRIATSSATAISPPPRRHPQIDQAKLGIDEIEIVV